MPQVWPRSKPTPTNTRLEGLDRLAWLMDRAVRIPGTNITIGLDAILGLLPVGGDVLTGIVQAGIVLTALYRYRVPKAVAARMVANVLLDIGVGAIPFVGDVFDIFFKANTRNLALLNEARALESQGQAMPETPSKRYLLTVGALLGGAIVLVVGLLIALIVWVIRRPL